MSNVGDSMQKPYQNVGQKGIRAEAFDKEHGDEHNPPP
jgi:hypothetical protein